MAKLKLSPLVDERPVRITVELPAQVHRNLVAYADVKRHRNRPPPHCLTLNATAVGLLPHLLCYRAQAGSEAYAMRQISMSTRGELLDAIGNRYRTATRRQRSRILDEFVAVAGYHRKRAIRLLRAEGVRAAGAERASHPDRGGRGSYGPGVREALIQLWKVSDRVCGKRLRPMIPALLPRLERHGRVALDPAARAQVLRVSAATIDRLLADVRTMAGLGRRRPAGFGSSVRRSVPVRTFNDWGSPEPGFVEVDIVAHGGTTVSGADAQTMVLTGIATAERSASRSCCARLGGWWRLWSAPGRCSRSRFAAWTSTTTRCS